MSLPNLSTLTLHIDAKAESNRKKNRVRAAPYNKKEVGDKETDEDFNVVLNNCAAYVLKVFQGFAVCPYGPLWQYAPTRCKPLAGSVADMPDAAEQERVVSIFLKGAPAFLQSFSDLLVFVQQRDFTAFILSTAPHKTKVKWNSTSYHAMVGLLFEYDDMAWGTTFGAYPTGALTEGSCSSRGSCSNKVTIVLGDQIDTCAREQVPRQMRVKTRVPGDAIRAQLVKELEKLTGPPQ
jgi:hypothetical protein